MLAGTAKERGLRDTGARGVYLDDVFLVLVNAAGRADNRFRAVPLREVGVIVRIIVVAPDDLLELPCVWGHNRGPALDPG